MTDQDTAPEAVERAIGMCRAHGLHGTEATLRALSAERDALEAAEMSAKHWHARAEAAEADITDLAQKSTRLITQLEAERDALRAKLAVAVGVMRRADRSLGEHLPHDGQSRVEIRAFLARHQKEADT